MISTNFSNTLLLSAAAVVATMFASADALAQQPGEQACIAAFDEGQVARKSGSLIEAKGKFTICAQASCAEAVRTQCSTWFSQVSQEIPSLSIRATDASGNDLSAVKVTIDGTVVASELTGTTYSVDPGEHVIVLSNGKDPDVTKKVLVTVGERNRPINVSFGKPATPGPGPVSPVPGPAPLPVPGGGDTGGGDGGIPVWTWPALGVGVAGMVLGGVFAGLAGGNKSDLETACEGIGTDASGKIPLGSCQGDAQGLHDDWGTNGTVSTIGFVVGGAGLALGAVGLIVGLTGDDGSDADAVSLSLGVNPNGLSLMGRF